MGADRTTAGRPRSVRRTADRWLANASVRTAMDEAAERMLETARSRPLGDTAELVVAVRAQVERCRAAVARGCTAWP
jgi:hypothetical protein